MNKEHTLDEWRQLAMHYEAEWSRCSSAFNHAAGELRKQIAEGKAREDEMRAALKQWVKCCETTNPARTEIAIPLQVLTNTEQL